MKLTDKMIRSALDAVFKELGKGVRAHMPFVVSMALQKLQITPEKFRTVEEQVRAYIIRSHKKGGKYQIAAGKNGGVFIRTKATNVSSKLTIPVNFTFEVGPTTLPSEVVSLLDRWIGIWEAQYHTVGKLSDTAPPKLLSIQVNQCG